MDTARPLTPVPSINKGYAIALTGVFFWSTTAIFIRYLLTRYTLLPLTLAFWRDLFTTSALALALFVARRDLLRIEKRHRLFLLGYGASLVIMNGLWTYSVDLNGAAISTVLVYASPAFTAIAARLIFGERLTRLCVAAILASLVGLVLVSGAHQSSAWTENLLGIGIGVASAIGFTLYSLMGRASARRGVNSWTATLSAFAVATVVFFCTQNGGTLFTLDGALDGWLILFVLAVVPTLAGFGLYTASLAHLPAGTANLIATLEPVLTALWAFLLLHESFSIEQWIGSALILGGVVSLRGNA